MTETLIELNSNNKDINLSITIKIYVTRDDTLDILKQQCNNYVRKHFFEYRVANLWIESPSKVVDRRGSRKNEPGGAIV